MDQFPVLIKKKQRNRKKKEEARCWFFPRENVQTTGFKDPVIRNLFELLLLTNASFNDGSSQRSTVLVQTVG